MRVRLWKHRYRETNALFCEGSSAGAGSGDCHNYLQGRRAEIFRLEGLQAKSEKEKADKKWQEELDARKAESDAAKAKKAEKRNKKKQKRPTTLEDPDNAKKQKLEEPAKIVIHKLSGPSAEEEVAEDSPKTEEEAPAKIKQVVGVILNDD